MKKLDRLLTILMLCSVGVLIGHSLFLYIDHIDHPGLYEIQSAPWYTSILLYGGVTLFVVAVSLVVKLIIRWNSK